MTVTISKFISTNVMDRGQLRRTSNLSIVLLVILCLLIAQSITYRIWRAYSTSLRSVPGPLHAKLTGFALKWHDVNGSRWYYVLSLHKKYGPIVRIAPYEVAISDPKAVRKVHAHGTEFRKRQQPRTASNIFSMSDPKLHRSRQRFYTHTFSPETVKSCNEPAVRELAQMAIAGVKRDASDSQDRCADMYKWCMLFGYDVPLQLIYGHTNGLMANNETSDKIFKGFHLQRINSWALFCYPALLLGRWLSPFSAKLRDIFCCEWRYVDLFEEGQRQRDLAAKTVFVQNTKYSKDDKGVYGVSDHVKLTDMDIAHDSATFLGAGGEAVGTTLVYLIWTLLRMPDLQKELELEVGGLTEPLTDASTAQLPILNSIIYETLRLYGGGATHLPRYSAIPSVLCGYTIPPGTAVTSHSGALHRNSEAWDDPETFDHRRWLLPTQSKALVQDKFQPFSSGARVCIATYLVMIELRLFVATFFRECAGVRLAPSTTEASMKIIDRFHIGPVSHRCEVIVPGPHPG